MIEQTRKLGWLAVEFGFLAVVICMLLNIIVGEQSGSFIAAVSANGLAFLQSLPSGVTVGVAMILVVYLITMRSRT